jgi:hypothetical protein
MLRGVIESIVVLNVIFLGVKCHNAESYYAECHFP